MFLPAFFFVSMLFHGFSIFCALYCTLCDSELPVYLKVSYALILLVAILSKTSIPLL